MAELFIVLKEYESTITPKTGKMKGIEYTRKEMVVLTSTENNYILATYAQCEKDSSDNLYEFKGEFYKQLLNSNKYFGSLEHAITSYCNDKVGQPDEDILTTLDLCKELNKQILSKREFIQTWLPIIIEKKTVEKKPLDY